jgi:hypothetical protein
VTDVISPDIVASVSCPTLTVPAGGSIDCTYSSELPDAASRTNTATATLQNFVFASDFSSTPDETTDFDGSADVVFGDAPTDNIDECVTVTDSYAGALFDGMPVCVPGGPYVAEYTRTVTFTDYDCGPHTVENTATFTTTDTQASGSDDCTVYFDVRCQDGCTLTQGYWKTHSEYGPAPYDETWAMLPEGADTDFFLSGQSYYEVLHTPPSGGNVYYILAHQFIAAELNFLNGADPTDAQAAFDDAADFFMETTPDAAAGLRGRAKREFNDLATTLDDYNNGLIGPGHCSE